MLALAAQFAGDFVASSARERLYGGLGVRELAAEVRPIYAIDLALSPLGLAVAFAAIGLDSQLVAPLSLPSSGCWLFSRERHARLEQLAELNDAYQGTALLLGDVVEADDAYTGEHCKSVVPRPRRRRRARPRRGARRRVEFAALLHDVGKIALPKEIINKPGKLDEGSGRASRPTRSRASGCSRRSAAS